MSTRVLLVLPVESTRQERLVAVLSGTHRTVRVLRPPEEWSPLHSALALGESDLLVVDSRLLPNPAAAGEPLEHLRRTSGCEVVVLEAHPPGQRSIDGESHQIAAAHAQWLAAGAVAVLDPLLDDDLLRRAFEKVVARCQQGLSQQPGPKTARDPRLAATHAASFSGASQPTLSLRETRSETMRKVLQLAQRVATSDTSVLLLGESGAGKEWLARGIHEAGHRAQHAFFAVNCAAVPEPLLESELFGHERGAFTGAERAHRGYFELAHGGTLFLDEIGEMPRPMQTRLLRVLQDGEVRRIGGERSLEVDVRVIAATNRSAEHLTHLAQGGLREDLYYRLAVMVLEVPALRDRREDIVNLFSQQIRRFAPRRPADAAHEQTPLISSQAQAALLAYGWPGNVRELINVAERAVLLCDDGPITLDHLPRQMIPPHAASAPDAAASEVPRHAPLDLLHFDLAGVEDFDLEALRRRVVESLERAVLDRLLRATAGNLNQTARRAGIDPRTLYNKMRHYGLDKATYRGPGAAPRHRPHKPD